MLQSLQAQNQDGKRFREIIVVDGAADGGTIACISNTGISNTGISDTGSRDACIGDVEIITLRSAKGRAAQMNRGAEAAVGDILLFLHADTDITAQGFQSIKDALAAGKFVGGAFNLCTRGMNLFIKHIYITSYLRSRISRIPYGDQAIFIRKDYFWKRGGFPDVPIMEDVELMRGIKKNKDKIVILKDKVRTSPRRYEEEGYLYGWLRNHRIRFLHFFGVPPRKLVRLYPDTRQKKPLTGEGK